MRADQGVIDLAKLLNLIVRNPRWLIGCMIVGAFAFSAANGLRPVRYTCTGQLQVPMAPARSLDRQVRLAEQGEIRAQLDFFSKTSSADGASISAVRVLEATNTMVEFDVTAESPAACEAKLDSVLGFLGEGYEERLNGMVADLKVQLEGSRAELKEVQQIRDRLRKDGRMESQAAAAYLWPEYQKLQQDVRKMEFSLRRENNQNIVYVHRSEATVLRGYGWIGMALAGAFVGFLTGLGLTYFRVRSFIWMPLANGN